MVGKKKISKNDESYYVSVRNPSDTRRHLLESTKKSLMSLQNYHRLLKIRHEKSKHLDDLRQSIKELSYLNGRLFQKLPDYNSEIIDSFKRSKNVEKKNPKKSEKEPEKQVEKKMFENNPKHEHSELEKLEASLSAIEAKLKDLN